MHVDSIRMKLLILYFKVYTVTFFVKWWISVLENVFNVAKCKDPDEGGFHPGLHCLPKYQFSSQNETHQLMQCSAKAVFMCDLTQNIYKFRI